MPERNNPLGWQSELQKSSSRCHSMPSLHDASTHYQINWAHQYCFGCQRFSPAISDRKPKTPTNQLWKEFIKIFKCTTVPSGWNHSADFLCSKTGQNNCMISSGHHCNFVPLMVAAMINTKKEVMLCPT